MNKKIIAVAVWVGTIGALGLAKPGPTGTAFATFSALPSLSGSPSEAVAVNKAGTAAAGYSWDRSGLLHAVRWTLQDNGTWAIISLPWPPGASSPTAGAVNDGATAGNDFPGNASRAVYWPVTGGFAILGGCANELAPATVYGLSSDAQVVVGVA